MKDLHLGNSKISKIFWSFAIPGVLSMVATSTAQLIDIAFVGRVVGSEAVASITLVMPIIMILQGVAIMVAVGGSTYAGISRGRGEDKKSNNYFNVTVGLLIFAGLISTAVIFLLQPYMGSLLSIDGTTLGYVRTYSSTITLFFSFYMMNFMFSFFLNIDGKPQWSLIILLSGSILNIILDYVFIVKLGWGIKGAALGTGISQLVPWTTFIIVFLTKTTFKFHIPKFIPKDIKLMLFNGSSELLSVLSVSVASIIINSLIISRIGVHGIAAYAVALQIANIVFAVSYGLADSTRAATSFNYGANNMNRVKSILRYALISNLIFGLVIGLGSFIFGFEIASIFLKDKNVIDLSIFILKFYSVAYLLIGINLTFGTYYTSVDSPLISATITFLRAFAILIPLMIILSYFIGANGIWYAIALNEILTTLIALVIHKKYPTGKIT